VGSTEKEKPSVRLKPADKDSTVLSASTAAALTIRPHFSCLLITLHFACMITPYFTKKPKN
jgi:hypothetical protein